MSIAEKDRPGLDTFGHVLFLLACAAVVAAIAALINPEGVAPLVLAAIAGVYLGLVGTSCFVRGYRRQRETAADTPQPALH